MLFRKLSKQEVMTILTKDIFNKFKYILFDTDDVLFFNENGYVYRNNGNGVIIRKENEYLFDICIHKDIFKMTYEEYINKLED